MDPAEKELQSPNINQIDNGGTEDTFTTLETEKVTISTKEQQLKNLSQIVNSTMKDIFQSDGEYVDHDYYLFGGAVRDTLQNKYEFITDLDIYINWTQGLEELNHVRFAEKLSITFDSVKLVNTEDLIHGYINQFVSAIIKIKDKRLPYDVDLVIGDVSLKEFLDSAIDFNFCKIALNTKEKNIIKALILTHEYIYDSDNNTITFDNSILGKIGYEFSLKTRLPKILKKYPDFQFEYNQDMYPISVNKDILFSMLDHVKKENTITVEHLSLIHI